MRPRDDNDVLEDSLRLAFGRRQVPASLRNRVMAAVRAAGTDQPVRRTSARAFGWLPMRTSWGFGACAVMALGALVWLVGPPGKDQPDTEAVALDRAELELAEVLQLAGHKWNQAQEAALSPIQGAPNE